MQFRALLLSALATIAFAAVNQPCEGPGGVSGVCMNANTCTTKGGSTINGACPSDPAGIKCCVKPVCPGGTCKWNSDCKGGSKDNLCPGPGGLGGFKCCQSREPGFGGYQTPIVPPVGACKAVAVGGARNIVNAPSLRGRIRQVFCKRDCACGSGSDHCCGLAVDLMCSDAGGTPTLGGKDIAEYTMRQAGPLKVKYVIWGQRIWNRQDGVKPWAQWKPMENRGDVTSNHWDHVHVSFNE